MTVRKFLETTWEFATVWIKIILKTFSYENVQLLMTLRKNILFLVLAVNVFFAMTMPHPDLQFRIKVLRFLKTDEEAFCIMVLTANRIIFRMALWMSMLVLFDSKKKAINFILRMPWVCVFTKMMTINVARLLAFVGTEKNLEAHNAFAVVFVLSLVLITQIYVAFEIVLAKCFKDAYTFARKFLDAKIDYDYHIPFGASQGKLFDNTREMTILEKARRINILQNALEQNRIQRMCGRSEDEALGAGGDNKNQKSTVETDLLFLLEMDHNAGTGDN